MAEVATAWISLLPSAKGFGSKLDAEIGPSVDSAGKKRGLSFGKLFAAGAALSLGAKAFSFLGDSLAEATEAGKVTARTENVIAKMGNAANISADQVGALAASLSAKAGIDDEAIQSGQNMLLTFGNIRNEAGKGNKIFDETSRLMVDMSAAMGTDATSSAKQLGKALNDPVKGVTALTRSGVSFTQQQKDQIKTLQESGDMLGAQKIILGEVERQFGGAAESMATPAEKLGVAWGNLKEDVGTAILPMFERLATWATDTLIPALSKLGPVFGAIGDFFGPLVEKVQAFFASFSGAGGTGQLAQVQATFASVFGAIKSIVSSVVTILTALWRAFGGTLVTFAKAALTLVMNVISGAFKVIQGIFNVIAGLLTGDWRRMWNGIKQIVSGAWKIIKAYVKYGWAAIKAAFSIAATVLKGIFSRLWDGIKRVATSAWNALKGIVSRGWERLKTATITGIANTKDEVAKLPGKVKNAIGDVTKTLYQKGKDLVTGLGNGIYEWARDWLKGKVESIAGWIPGWIKKRLGIASPSKVTTELGRQIAAGLGLGIDAGRADVVAASKRLTDSIIDPTMSLDYRGIRGNARAARSAAVASQAGLLAELQALRAEVARQTAVTARLGHDFGMEVNGMFADGARGA